MLASYESKGVKIDAKVRQNAHNVVNTSQGKNPEFDTLSPADQASLQAQQQAPTASDFTQQAENVHVKEGITPGELATIKKYGDNTTASNAAFQTDAGGAQAHANAFSQHNIRAMAVTELLKGGGNVANTAGQSERDKGSARATEFQAFSDLQKQTSQDMEAGIQQLLSIQAQLRDSAGAIANTISQMVNATRPA